MARDRQPLPGQKQVRWMGSSRKDLRELPKEVREVIGQALFHAQRGARHASTKILSGFGGAGVLEVIEDGQGSTYRTAYTVRFAGYVYVLHVFKKKSKSGIKTPPADIDLIRRRMKEAERDYAEIIDQADRIDG